jgi:succinyl-CoA synthetase beta subunit
MNIHEYQAKQLLAKHGVPAPAGGACTTPQEAKSIAEKLFSDGQKRVVVKAQTHAGGRGKGHFKSGLKGGVKLCSSPDEVFTIASQMLGQVLVTNQTGPEGRRVSRLLIEAASAIKKEFYLAVLLDRATSWPLMMVSTAGGMDIEEIAANHPEKIIRELIDPAVGMMPYQARRLAVALGLNRELIQSAAKLILGVYRTWWETEASLVEINPLCLVELPDGTTSLVVDAKMSFDDNALYRHPEIMELRDLAEESPLEIDASNYNLSYIKLDGNIACMVNGAGLAMATMDVIQQYGGQPANFLDVGGGATTEQVAAGFRIILKDPDVKGILVNIFGGIMQCDTIARGILEAAREYQIPVPLVVRLSGSNETVGQQIIAESGLALQTANTLAEAAQKVVAAVKGVSPASP